MIIWGHYNRQRPEDTGHFDCPQCDQNRGFTLLRTWKYFHIYFIPIVKEELVAEDVVCQECGGAFPVTVLVAGADDKSYAFMEGIGGPESVLDNIKNVVEFTDAALEEILQRYAMGKFDDDVAVRVEPDRSGPRAVRIAFDLALADGRDWIGQSQGFPIVIDRRVASELEGSIIDFNDGEFFRK